MINVKQFARFVVELGDQVAPSDIEEGMRVGFVCAVFLMFRLFSLETLVSQQCYIFHFFIFSFDYCRLAVILYYESGTYFCHKKMLFRIVLLFSDMLLPTYPIGPKEYQLFLEC